MGRIFLLLSLLLLATSCAESSSGSSQTVTVPQVMIDCTTALCKTNVNPFVVYVRITQSSCDPAFDNWATLAASFTVSCTASGGCSGSTTSWVNERGQTVTTFNSGSYTICGRIDYNGNYPGTTTDDSTAESDGVAISQSAMLLRLDGWKDP